MQPAAPSRAPGSFGSLAEEPRANRATLVAAPLYWFGDMSCLWAALRAFDIALSPQALVLAYATGFLANMLPLPTGGSAV